MSKLIKNCYYDRNGNKKVNNYLISVSKKMIQEAGIKDTDNIKIYVEGNKIILVNE